VAKLALPFSEYYFFRASSETKIWQLADARYQSPLYHSSQNMAHG